MTKVKPKTRSSVNKGAGSIKALWTKDPKNKHEVQPINRGKSVKHPYPKGDYDYDGGGVKRGTVQCSTCRGGEDQRYRCSLIGCTPVDGCRY
jgi:hypothetical protein